MYLNVLRKSAVLTHQRIAWWGRYLLPPHYTWWWKDISWCNFFWKTTAESSALSQISLQWTFLLWGYLKIKIHDPKHVIVGELKEEIEKMCRCSKWKNSLILMNPLVRIISYVWKSMFASLNIFKPTFSHLTVNFVSKSINNAYMVI